MADLGDILRGFAQGATPTLDYFAKKKQYEQELLYGQQQEQQKMQQQMPLFAIKQALAQQAAGQRAQAALDLAVKKEGLREQTKRNIYEMKRPEREGRLKIAKERVDIYRTSVEQAGKTKVSPYGITGVMTAEDLVDYQTKVAKLEKRGKKLDPGRMIVYRAGVKKAFGVDEKSQTERMLEGMEVNFGLKDKKDIEPEIDTGTAIREVDELYHQLRVGQLIERSRGKGLEELPKEIGQRLNQMFDSSIIEELGRADTDEAAQMWIMLSEEKRRVIQPNMPPELIDRINAGINLLQARQGQ